MKTEPNHPANPITEEETDRIDAGVKMYSGLTKREHFAGLAMQGFIISGKRDDACKMAVDFADLLIAELNKETL